MQAPSWDPAYGRSEPRSLSAAPADTAQSFKPHGKPFSVCCTEGCSREHPEPAHPTSQWGKEGEIPKGPERHLQDGLNITSEADIFNLGATL